MQQLNQSAEVMVMNADGTAVRRIADQSSSLINPVWSANGRHIYLKKGFTVSPDGNTIVFEYAENKKYGIHMYEIKENREWKIIGDT